VVGQLGGEFRASTNFLVGAADAYAGAEAVGSCWESGALAKLGCQSVLLEKAFVCLFIVWRASAIVREVEMAESCRVEEAGQVGLSDEIGGGDVAERVKGRSKASGGEQF